MNKLRIVLFLPLFGFSFNFFSFSTQQQLMRCSRGNLLIMITSITILVIVLILILIQTNRTGILTSVFVSVDMTIKNRYQRYDLQGSYRFKLNNGWIQPGLKIRQDFK